MPLYDFDCSAGCGKVLDVIAKIDDMTIPCPQCGADCKRLITARYAVHDDLDYYDDTLCAHIKSRKHHRQVMAEQGVVPRYGKGWY